MFKLAHLAKQRTPWPPAFSAGWAHNCPPPFLPRAAHRLALPQAVNGFLNLASLNLSIGEIAQRIAHHHRVPVQTMPDSPTYSFNMDTLHAQQVLQWRFDTDLSAQGAAFTQAWQSPAPAP